MKDRGGGIPRERGLPPFTGIAPEVLILGSFPSKMSLEQHRYYANPRNQFWAIMADLLTGRKIRDAESVSGIILAHRIALWDVIATRSYQAGSMDHDISDPEWNDIPRFLEGHPTIRFIGTNGRMAGECLRRSLHGDTIGPAGIRIAQLPSTSPAYASCSYEQKRAKWSIILGYLSGQGEMVPWKAGTPE